ncbi:LysE family translocator [Poseidonocella sedimentorum]|uniref:Threonine/homoserine/homoserine lactone efflux protein n=1 Tax=Poseidonocella sedimentorum TaxID=871652 RepID=A0A1I6DUT9_9RHOB|nr:LysE family translocator [Poseidonocella sedimentorum]SFR09101.1 Threonine/homoserine/homoserine lactone efflux protein [Poseidonocella sedimentorum]
MTLVTLLPLVGFCLSSALSPGPNNLMLMASGANFGLRRSVPHMAGVGLGFPAMVALVGLGVMGLFDRVPGSYEVLRILSALYLLWLAWKIATAQPTGAAQPDARGRPLSFLQASAFQWVNPKAWSMALSAITLFAASRDVLGVARVAGVYVSVSVLTTTSWVLLGIFAARLLDTPRRLVWLNRAMALLLAATLLQVLRLG